MQVHDHHYCLFYCMGSIEYCLYDSLAGVTKVPNTSGQSFVPSSMSVHVPSPRSEGDILSSPNLKPFTYSELKNATRNFRPDSLLGEGGYGYVYKGWIDEHTLRAGKPGCGMIVAVKKLNSAGLPGHNNEWLVGFFIRTKSSICLNIWVGSFTDHS